MLVLPVTVLSVGFAPSQSKAEAQFAHRVHAEVCIQLHRGSRWCLGVARSRGDFGMASRVNAVRLQSRFRAAYNLMKGLEVLRRDEARTGQQRSMRCKGSRSFNNARTCTL